MVYHVVVCRLVGHGGVCLCVRVCCDCLCVSMSLQGLLGPSNFDVACSSAGHPQADVRPALKISPQLVRTMSCVQCVGPPPHRRRCCADASTAPISTSPRSWARCARRYDFCSIFNYSFFGVLPFVRYDILIVQFDDRFLCCMRVTCLSAL